MKLIKHVFFVLMAIMIFPTVSYAIYDPDRPVNNKPDEITTTSVDEADLAKIEDKIRVTGQEKAAEKRANIKNRGEERRSTVARAVQEILLTADRTEPGIGKQIRDIARQQNEGEAKIHESVEKINSRGKGLRLLLGPDWKEIKEVRKEMNQNTERIIKLKRTMNQMDDGANKNELAEHIEVLEVQNDELYSIVGEKTKGFSLLGWLFKLIHGA